MKTQEPPSKCIVLRLNWLKEPNFGSYLVCQVFGYYKTSSISEHFGEKNMLIRQWEIFFFIFEIIKVVIFLTGSGLFGIANK